MLFTKSFLKPFVHDCCPMGEAGAIFAPVWGEQFMSKFPRLRAALAGAMLVGGLGLTAPGTAAAEAGRHSSVASDSDLVVTAPGRPELFGTVALPTRADRFAGRWRRVSQSSAVSPALARLVAPARGLTAEQQLFFIQTAVSRDVPWISDATQWGFHDYWATANETLERGGGDGEDQAIVKMQALRALGIPARDMFLTMGRDDVGGPMTMLMVRIASGYYALEELRDRPIRQEARKGFTPILSLGINGAWLHGRRVDRTASGAVTAAAASRVTYSASAGKTYSTSASK